MSPELTLVRAASGECPYCGCASYNDVPVLRPHPHRTVVKCTSCDRHSTRGHDARRYPHDDPSDPNSPHALGVRVEL